MTSEYNFGVSPLYNDIGSPFQNMAKNEYTTLDNYSYFRYPTRKVINPFLKPDNISVIQNMEVTNPNFQSMYKLNNQSNKK
jgi:hypothetical protein